MSAYWLGFFTLPAVLLVLRLAVAAAFRLERFARRHGFTCEVRPRPRQHRLNDYVIRRDVWWEQQHGPVFTGGWYREEPKFQEPSPIYFTRWVGIGPANGPCVTFFRKRYLGMTDAHA